MDKVILTEEKETLLIPLYGKAKESKKVTPILVDPKAMEIVDRIDYNFKALKIPEKTNIMMSIRAKLIDNFVKDFLARHGECLALHLGCGLDSRYCRIGNQTVDWYDVDFKEVMDIRRLFYPETAKYHLLASSVTEKEWLEHVPKGEKPAIVIAEGLLMYLKEEEIKGLIRRLKERIGGFTLILDAFSVFAARKANNHPSIKKTGAAIHWGVDDPEEPTRWGLGMELLTEQYFTDNEEIAKLNSGMRMAFRLANLFPVAKKAQRLLVYKVG